MKNGKSGQQAMNLRKTNKIMPRRSDSLSCQSDKKFSEHLKPVDEKKLIRTQAIDTPKDKTHNS